MEPTITVALIMMIGTVGAQFTIGYLTKRSTDALINYRVGELEKKVMAHNNLVIRMIQCESDICHINEKIETMKGDI